MSRRSKILAASFAFMFSYMVTRFLNSVASASSVLDCGVRHAASNPLSSDHACLEPLLRGLEQALAHFELFRARVELGAALLQPLENGALGRR